jgi:hypothetical protein
VNASLLWRLLLAHVIADFPLQPDYLIAAKRKAGGLIIHAVLFGLTATVMCRQYIGRFYELPMVLAGLTVFHGLLDWGKSALTRKIGRDTLSLFLADQMLHISSLIFAAYLLRFRPMIYEPANLPIALGVLAVWAVPIFVNLGHAEFTGVDVLPNTGMGASKNKLGMLERLGLFVAGVAQGWFLLAGLMIVPRIVFWAKGNKPGHTPINWALALGLGLIASVTMR